MLHVGVVRGAGLSAMDIAAPGPRPGRRDAGPADAAERAGSGHRRDRLSSQDPAPTRPGRATETDGPRDPAA